MTAPTTTTRDVITTAAQDLGWKPYTSNANCNQFTHGWAVLTILWTSAGDVFAATLSGDGNSAPDAVGLIPVSDDDAAAEAVLIGWLQGTRYRDELVRDISAPEGTVTELDFATRGRR